MEIISTSSTQQKLDTLPEEILDSIARFAPQDIRSLRSSCKAVEQKTFHAFLKVVINVRTLWVNRPSMTSLRNLSQSERLAPHVQKIIIMPYEWDVDLADALWADGSDLDEGEAKEFKEFYEEWTEQTYLAQSGAWTMYLAQLLAAFPNLDGIDMFPSFMNEDFFGDHTRLTFQERTGLSQSLSSDYINQLWFSLCQAIIGTDWKPKSIRVGLDQDNHLHPDGLICLPKPQRKYLTGSFAQLNKLYLAFSIPNSNPDHKMLLKALNEFLKLCTNVSELALQVTEDHEDSYSYDDDERYISNVEAWPIFPNLEYFEFSYARCNSVQLRDFLKKHRATLRELILIELDFVEEDIWRIFLEGVGEELDLDKADISLYEERHGNIDMINAKRPNIKQAIQDRVLEGIFCYRCSRPGGFDSPPTMDSDEYSSDGAELDSEMHSLADDDEEDDWEDEV